MEITTQVPFVLHAIIETLAAVTFIFRPETQVSDPSLETQLVFKLLGGSLLSTNLICLVIAARPVFDQTTRLVAASLAFWHLWPVYRAGVRLAGTPPQKRPDQSTLGGPSVHLAIHLLLFAMFFWIGISMNGAAVGQGRQVSIPE
jgi:hypothetical protein